VKTKLFDFIINHKILVSAVLLGITIFFGWHAARIEIDTDIERYFLEDDLRDYDRFLEEFGTDQIIVVAFEGEDTFGLENLRLVDSISGKLEKLPHVRRVYSLTTAKIIYGEGNTVYFDPLMDEIPSTTGSLIPIKQRALDDAFIPETLMSSDKKSTAIIAEIDHIIGESDHDIDLARQIKALLKEEEIRTGKRFYAGGRAIMDEALFNYTQVDNARLVLLSALLMMVITLLMFRQIVMTILPMSVVLLTYIWTYGIMSLLEYKVSSITTIIRPLLMAVAIAGSMHIIADYLQRAAGGKRTKIECIRQSFNNLITPCFMAGLTTAIGLLSLQSSGIRPLRELGLVAAVGVIFAFFIGISLLPILLSIVPFPKERNRERIQGGLLAKVLLWLGRWQKRRAIAIFLISFAAIIPAVLLLPQISIGANTLRYFRTDDLIRIQTEWIDTNISGTNSLEFFIDAEQENAFKDPLLLRKMERFQDYLKGIDGVTEVYCAVDLVKTLNKAFHGGNEQECVIPPSFTEVSQQLFIIEGSEEIEQFLSYDYSKARIMARVNSNRTRYIYDQMPEIEKYMNGVFGESEKITPTGTMYMFQRMEDYIVSSQIKSFILAFIVIEVIMMLILRSLKLGIFAMIPNFLPILFGTAMMPVLGIPLNIGTAMPAVVTLGLVVDDTIHFLSRLKLEMDRTDNIKNAIANSMNHTGRAIIFTSIVLGFGFMALLPAKFVPVAYFGILAGIVILFALVFDLVVLPAIMGFAWSDRERGRLAADAHSSYRER
jgi:hydrophobe/amphiphile efflux-3 (HAE3) family protein